MRAWLVIAAMAPFFTPFPAALAASDPVSDFFAEGVSAFRDGAYAKARTLFAKAKSAGNDSPSLHYNLGVTDYRLGYYPSAIDAFKAAAADPALAALAYYNLGLVYARMENVDEAARWFSLAQEAAPDTQLKQLAATAYVRVTAVQHTPEHSQPVVTVAAPGAPGKDEVLKFSIETSVGMADTVISNQAAFDRLQSSDGDQYVALQMAFGLQVSPRIFAELHGLRRDYVNLNSFDLANFGAGLDYRYPLSVGHIRYGASLELNSQGDAESQRVTTLHIAGSYDVEANQSVMVGYRRGIITALDPNYAYIGGQRDLFEASWTFSTARRHLSAFGQYEYNDRSDYYENNVFIASTSPSRFALGLAADSAFWMLEASAMGAFAVSIYGDADYVSDNSRRQRRDETAEFQAKLAWRISKNTRLSMDYQFVSNRSVFSRYWYDYNRASLAFEWSV